MCVHSLEVQIYDIKLSFFLLISKKRTFLFVFIRILAINFKEKNYSKLLYLFSLCFFTCFLRMSTHFVLSHYELNKYKISLNILLIPNIGFS